MFPAIDVEFIDYDKFRKNLNGLEKDIRTKARYAGVLEMSKPLKKTIKANLAGHVKTGALSASIGHRKITAKSKSLYGLQNDEDGLVVGSVIKQYHGSLVKKRSQAYKMRWLEEGTDGHWIEAGKTHQKRLRFKGIFVGGKVWHPGTKAENILKDSNRDMQSQYQNLFYKGAQKALARYGVTLANF